MPAKTSDSQPTSQADVDGQALSFAPLKTVYQVASTSTPEYITYSKGVQTTEPWSSASEDSDDNASRSPTTRRRKRLSRREREQDDEIRRRLRTEIEAELKALHFQEASDNKEKSQERFPTRVLTHDEQVAVTSSTDFSAFVERSTKVIERALDQEYDILADYAADSALLDDDDDEQSAKTSTHRGRRLKEIHHFQDDKWSARRMVTDLDYSQKYPELLLASYTKPSNKPGASAGVALVWNSHMTSKPEYAFTANSDVLCASFSPHHPKLVLGGTYSGQVCLWDMRVQSNDGAPVQTTPLAGEYGGHAHPVYSLAVVGTQHANNIVSVSTDGTACAWTFDMLAKPIEHLSLTTPPDRHKTDQVAPTCISFSKSDQTYFLAGTEQGGIVSVQRYDRAGQEAGVDPRGYYKGHVAPVTSLEFHPSRGKVDLADLALSSAFDWSIKLWRARPQSSGVLASNVSGTSHESPLLDIAREEIVYDVKWSPVKPGVFGSVDGAGRLDIFDLNVDLEVPVSSAQTKRAIDDVFGVKSLNKLAWEKNQGRRVAVGGLDGVVTVFETGVELGGAESLGNLNEWLKMRKLVSKLDRGGLA